MKLTLRTDNTARKRLHSAPSTMFCCLALSCCVHYYRVDSVNLTESDAKKNTHLFMNSWLWDWTAVKLLY